MIYIKILSIDDNSVVIEGKCNNDDRKILSYLLEDLRDSGIYEINLIYEPFGIFDNNNEINLRKRKIITITTKMINKNFTINKVIFNGEFKPVSVEVYCDDNS